MPAIVILNLKKTNKSTMPFLQTVEPYITNQGFANVTAAAGQPRMYLSLDTTKPAVVKGIISTIKNTLNYTKVADSIFYTTHLMKS